MPDGYIVPDGSAGPEGPLGPFLLLAVLTTSVMGGLLFGRRRGRHREPEPSPAPVPEVGTASLALASATVPLGPPPVLLPAAIIRQVLFEASELAPTWARPHTTPEPASERPLDEAAAEPSMEPQPTIVQPELELEPEPAPTAAEDVKPAKRTRRPKSSGTTTRRRTKSSG
jgi:hypothetical protein